MRQIVCVRLKQWPIDRIRRKRPRHRHEPLVLVRTVANRQLVVCACELARSSGITAGMSLPEARALCADLGYAEHRPDEDRKSLEALARWMIRFSPLVAIEPPDAVVLDVTGSDRLFGGLPRLMQLISAAVTKLNLSHGIALAPTLGAAWALASFG